MGISPADVIEQAGKHLLARLSGATSLPYSTFYDGQDETHERLCQAVGLEDDWYSAEALVDLAIVQLREQGIVTTQPLTTKLADGQEDFLIELTKRGREKLSAGFTPRYRDME